jgi:hypothetical protein
VSLSSPELRAALLSSETSRRNKMWLACNFKSSGGYLYWHWKGEPYRSRLIFNFFPGDIDRVALSYDEDVLPKLKFGKEKP